MDKHPGTRQGPDGQWYSTDGKMRWDGKRWVLVLRWRPTLILGGVLGVVTLLAGICTVAVMRSPDFQQGANAGARAALASPTPTPTATPKPSATPSPSSSRPPSPTRAPAPTAVKTPKPASDALAGFGATSAGWILAHTSSSDSGLAPGCCYNADPSLPEVNGHIGYRYYAVNVLGGRILNYQVEMYRNTNYAEARAEMLREFPPDAVVLWEASRDTCAQMEVQSAALGQALGASDPKGRAAVEFSTGIASYDPEHITDAILDSGDYATAADAAGC
jgi:hypothetical protein